MNKTINNFNKVKICIICEGFEEYEYLDHLIRINVFDRNYDIKLINAKGNGNIFARYQDCYQRNMYNVIFVFCDTEQKPYNQFLEIKNKIDQLHDKSGVSDKCVIFANPCTMQIILLHFNDVVLHSNQKSKNAEVIEKLTGIKGYNATIEKRKELFSKISKDNYNEMKTRVKKFSLNSNDKNSSNISILFNYLEESDSKWLELFK